MKAKLFSIAFAFASLGLTFAADKKEKHDHDHEHIKAGPTGGRLIQAVEPHAEFFVTEDRKVEIRFVNDDNKVVAPGQQSIAVTAGDRKSPTKLTFAKEGDKLVSDKALPSGNDFPVVVQIKVSPDAKSVNEKFNLNLEQCPTCKHKEYACTCEHAH